MNRQQKNRKDRRRFSRLMSLALSASMVLGSNVFAYGSPVMDPNAAAAVIAEQAAEETVIEQQAGDRNPSTEIRGWEASVKSGVDLNRELRYGMSFNEVLDVLSNNVEIRSRIGTSGNETKLLTYGTDYVFDENSQVFSASQNAFKGLLSAGTPYTVQFKGAEGSGYTADAGFNPASVSVNFQLDKLTVSQNNQISVNLATKSFKYTGADQTPYPSSVSVNVGDFHLVANGRSEIEQLIAATNGISYRNNRNAGTDAAVEVRLNDNFNTTNGTVFGEAKFTITGISLSQNCTVTNTAAKTFQYNGAGQGPDKDTITITVGGRTLTAGADFDIVYLVNNAGVWSEAPVSQGNKPRSRGSYFAKIVGKGNYAGSEISYNDEKGKDLFFNIIGGTAFKAEDLTIELPVQAYTGRPVDITTSLKVKDKFSGEELTYKQDGTGDYKIDHYEDGSMTKIAQTDIIEPNYYYVVLEGTGAYQGDQVRVPFTVVKDSLANAIVNWANDKQPYDGEPNAPVIASVYLPSSAGNVLVPSSDYTYEVEEEDFIEAGNYNVTITGKNNYAGTQVVAEFSIAARSIAAAEVTAEDVPARADNNAKRLSVVVRDPSLKTANYAKELKLGKDYEYRDNGNGTVTIRGLYNYKDEQSVKINPANKMQLADSKITATLTAGFLQYANKALEPKENEFTVVEEGATQIPLRPGTDYEITNWYNNDKAGTGIAVMQGKGNYVGEKQVEFEIRGIDLSANYTIMEDGLLKEAAYNPAVSKDYAEDIKENLSRRVVDAKTGSAGKTLIQGTDYKVEFLQNGEKVREVRNAGVYTVVVKGKGQYSGELTYEFAIRGTDINTVLEASLSQNSFEYAGQPIEPEVTVKTKENKPLLKEGTDYEIVYVNNNQVTDKAYAVVRGLGAYEGTISLEFKITGDPSITPAPVGPQDQVLSVRYDQTLSRQLGLTLNMNGKAETAVQYKSSNTKVATVSSTGKVTCKAVGTAVITTTAVGTDEYKEATKTLTLTVMPKKVGVKSVKTTNKKGQAVVQSSTTTAGNDGYQIQYTNNGVTKRVGVKTSKKSVTKTLTKLTSGKKVRVRIRAYKYVDGKAIFGPYCNWKTTTTRVK